MIPVPILKELFDYNYWARDRQLEACAVLSQAEFHRSTGNGCPSAGDALTHLVGVEWLWLERLRGRSPKALPPAESFPDVAAIAGRWRSVEADMREYLARLDEQVLACPLTYTNLRGEAWSYPVWRVLLHVINHQTYHRGQVNTLLRQLGKKAAPLDLLIADDMGLFGTPRSHQG